MNDHIKPRHFRRRGSISVELALAFPFMTLMLFAIVQWGFIMNAELTVQQICRESARYAAVHINDATFNSPVTTADSFLWYVNGLAPTSGTVPYTSLYAVVPPTSSNGLATTTTYTTPQANINYWSNSSYSTEQNQYSVTVTVSYNMMHKVVLKPLVPGLPSTWVYTYQYTVFMEQPGSVS